MFASWIVQFLLLLFLSFMVEVPSFPKKSTHILHSHLVGVVFGFQK